MLDQCVRSTILDSTLVRLGDLVKCFHVVHHNIVTLKLSMKLIILRRNQSKGGITCIPLSALFSFFVPQKKQKTELC